MVSAKEIRKKCDADIKELQKICKHPKIIKDVQECWAPGHFTGKAFDICDNCEKRLNESKTNRGFIDADLGSGLT